MHLSGVSINGTQSMISHIKRKVKSKIKATKSHEMTNSKVYRVRIQDFKRTTYCLEKSCTDACVVAKEV